MSGERRITAETTSSIPSKFCSANIHRGLCTRGEVCYHFVSTSLSCFPPFYSFRFVSALAVVNWKSTATGLLQQHQGRMRKHARRQSINVTRRYLPKRRPCLPACTVLLVVSSLRYIAIHHVVDTCSAVSPCQQRIQRQRPVARRVVRMTVSGLRCCLAVAPSTTVGHIRRLRLSLFISFYLCIAGEPRPNLSPTVVSYNTVYYLNPVYSIQLISATVLYIVVLMPC